MSNKELHRLSILQDMIKYKTKLSKTAERLGLSIRQTIRLKNRLNKEGPKGLISKKIGKPSHHRVSQAQKDLVIAFVSQDNHRDFGPTLVHEYMIQEGSLKISISSVRNMMIEHGLWRPNELSKAKIHQLRPRRARKEMAQSMIGSKEEGLDARYLCMLMMLLARPCI